jgi:mannose-1-phosphate guanylyltransferase
MSSSTIAGFILAAGEGRRLRPASLLRPKALMPFCGVPLLELVAARMAALPVATLVVNACHLAEQVQSACRALAAHFPCPVRVSVEASLLDTGGGLRRGLELAPAAEQVLVHNADVILDVDLAAFLDQHLASGAIATALLVPERGPRTVELAPDGCVRHFRRPRGSAPYTFAGVYAIRRDLLRFLPAADACSIISACEGALAAGERVLGVVADTAFWSDVGTPADYIRAHGQVMDLGVRHWPRLRDAQVEQACRRAAIERAGVRCTGALGLGRNLGVPPGAHLHNAVLWDDTALTKPVLYADTVLTGPGVAAPPPVTPERQPDPRVYPSLGLTAAEVTVEPLRKQGSGRRYARLRAGDRSWVWCAYAHERRENAAFAALADFLERLGIAIPSVALHLGDAGEIVSRDLGDDDALGIRDAARLEGVLGRVLEQVARLHVLGARAARLEELPMQAGFTKGLYDWERDYFREHVLGRLLGAPELWSPAAAEYCGLRNRLLAEPPVPIHRDLQSANIMVLDHTPYLIDFQGMRLGAAVYDLGSLIFDPYRRHPGPLRARLWARYRASVSGLGGTPPDEDLLHAGAVQRLLQALGAYGKLWLGDGLDWYRPFLLPGLELLTEAADAGGFAEIARLARDAHSRAGPLVAATGDA